MFSTQAVERLKAVYVKEDCMWRLLFNGIHNNLLLTSENFSKDVFKKLDCYGFRIVNADGNPLIYGLNSDKCMEPLTSLKVTYPDAMYIEYVKKDGWQLCKE
jgi:hypothetical protein